MKIGDTIIINGKEFKLIPEKSVGNCEGCFFNESKSHCDSIHSISCGPGEFILVETDK